MIPRKKIQFAERPDLCMWNKTKTQMSMFDYTIIQMPGALGRKGAENGMIQVNNGREPYLLFGERIHGETLTVDVKCSSGKDAYPTYAAAEKALRLKSKNGKRTKRIYKCEECGCYHFTTNDGKSRKSWPYNREREKKYTQNQIMPLIGHYGKVDAGGFSMKRFQNSQNKLNYAF